MSLAKVAYVLLALCTRPISAPEAEAQAQLYLEIAPRWGLRWEEAVAVAVHENNLCDPSRVSVTNDVGLMQLHLPRRKNNQAVRLYMDPQWNVMRGCEVLWAARWGGPCTSDACFERWFARYNPGAKGYGRRVRMMLRRVERKAREYDEHVEAMGESSESLKGFVQ